MSDIVSVVEGLSAIALPLGSGIIAYVRWRKRADDSRDSRAQAATTAANTAAAAARAEEQTMRDRLLAEKDATISRLELMLQQEQANNSRLQNLLINRSNPPPPEAT